MKKAPLITFIWLMTAAVLLSQDNTHFIPTLNNTGEHDLTVFLTTVTGLTPGDEVGIFDENGLINDNNCNSEYDELLVGAGVYTGGQLEITSVGSVDNCPLGGFQLPGFVAGHHISVKIWNAWTNTEYPVHLVLETGSGVFGELFTVVNEIQFFSPAWDGQDPVTPMNIQIMSAEIQSFLPDIGDEIAVFDGDICVGSIKYSNGWEPGLNIVAGADSGTGNADGFISGHTMSFKLWDASDAFKENWVSVEITGDGDFTPYGFSQVSITGLSTDDPETVPADFSIISAYPTPFNSSVKIDYRMDLNSNLKIDVFDVTGKRMAVLYDAEGLAGYHTILWSPEQIHSGIFYIRFQTDTGLKSIPVIYLK